MAKKILVRSGTPFICTPIKGTDIVMIKDWGEEAIIPGEKLYAMNTHNKKVLDIYNKTKAQHKEELKRIAKEFK